MRRARLVMAIRRSPGFPALAGLRPTVESATHHKLIKMHDFVSVVGLAELP